MTMIIIEWLEEYLNTPQMEMSIEIEMLGMIAIAIISLAVMSVIGAICWVSYKIYQVIHKNKR